MKFAIIEHTKTDEKETQLEFLSHIRTLQPFQQGRGDPTLVQIDEYRRRPILFRYGTPPVEAKTHVQAVGHPLRLRFLPVGLFEAAGYLGLGPGAFARRLRHFQGRFETDGGVVAARGPFGYGRRLPSGSLLEADEVAVPALRPLHEAGRSPCSKLVMGDEGPVDGDGRAVA